ncbi:branched-chain amino acid ABC transporter permease [Phaeobacter sp. HF9A]|uniref:branched-chain amino acid ABC transporter permease n=1 Tax=Phaeobacter sp. HF9A TaxID=2721561 RepID=UPI00142FF0BC|nr:branched-chain amino acid ABC transporter permease [Phaeobacter sp. HF9A]NIZ13571.1 branched-chain amino acid ABC transporter permease [Phaeobacter sp. HF9A]
MDIFYASVNGVLLGGLYALYGLGLALTFGIMRTINLAHGDMIVFGSFMSLVVTRVLGLPALASLVVLIPAMFLLGRLFQERVMNRSLGEGIMPSIILTFGLSVVIQNALLLTFSADRQTLSAGQLQTMSLPLTEDFAIGVLPLMTLCVVIVLLIALNWFFRHTMLGRAFRATSDDPEVVALMGIDPRRTYGLAMGLAFAIIAITGVFMGLRTNFAPFDGPARLIFAFEVIIIGGMGSIQGVLIGGVILGVAQTMGNLVNPAFFQLSGHVATLLVLAIRPSGLFPETIERD